ncbi:MAG: mannonate dehydratase [Candidatus Latescibacteria bacterium]|jgi:mannonate dehydratase|nr:mannonate dehydratase [Candidatus Latescibacterota bacterium]
MATDVRWDPEHPQMHVGTQRFGTSDAHLEYLVRLGVNSMAATDITFDPERGWDAEELGAKKEKCASHGIDLEMVALPIHQFNEDGGSIPNYMLGNRAKGEKEIELVCKMIRATSDAGIPAVKYFLCEMENQRTESVPLGRGGSTYSTFDLSKADADTPRFGRPLSAEENWNRVTYFLERVIPVATECKVRMACHPCDPWLPPGFKGVDRVLGGAEGFKRFVEICPSPYHGLNLCLGCMAESVEDPATEVPEIIRYFGERKKIHLIHYRNIFGGRTNFQEVWPDEGVMDMFTIMDTLKSVGYPHMVVPDHAPGPRSEGSHEQAFAYQFGYIKAMIQAVNSARA